MANHPWHPSVAFDKNCPKCQEEDSAAMVGCLGLLTFLGIVGGVVWWYASSSSDSPAPCESVPRQHVSMTVKSMLPGDSGWVSHDDFCVSECRRLYVKRSAIVREEVDDTASIEIERLPNQNYRAILPTKNKKLWPTIPYDKIEGIATGSWIWVKEVERKHE